MKIEAKDNGDWVVTEAELKRHNRWCREPVGLVVNDPGFKIGQEVKEALKEGKILLVRRRK